MGNSILGIGASALAAAQAGMLTTGHNISNVNTPGYNRQETIQATSNALFTGGGYLGQGVDVASIRRVYSDFLTARTLSSQSQSSALTVKQEQLSQLDGLFGDATSGLSPALDSFFAGINAVAANPADTASRQTALSAAQGLVSRFHQLDDQITQLSNAANVRITGAIGTINNLGAQIATLNLRIMNASDTSGGTTPPNDLLDQRDQLLMELNKSVGATAVPQSDGSYNVFLSNGQALVTGAISQTMTVQPDPVDPQNLIVGLKSGASVVQFHSADFSGGELGGILTFRDHELAGAQNALGRVAVALTSAFNAQHRLGQDLNGAPGGDFFSLPAPAVQPALTNTGNANLQVSVVDGTQVTASDYRLAYDGTNYTLTRLADGTVQTFATLPQSVDGIRMTLAAGAAAAGDSFLIQPTRNAARDIGVAITNSSRIAAAAPIRTAASSSNVGTAAISQGTVDAGYPSSPLGGPVTLTYSKNTGMLTGFPATSPISVTVGTSTTTYAAGSPVPYTSGATISFGVRFSISGAPSDGDTFTIAPNTGGIGDNRNAQLLAGIARGNVLGGTTTIGGAYGQLVSSVGSSAQQAQVESDTQAHLLEQAQAAQQSVSGVNLDEEAANLQRYQQAYLAAGKLMGMATAMFDSILEIAK